MEERSGRRRRNKLRVPLHFVWATHKRLPLLTEDIERDVYRYIEKVCRDDRCDVLAIGGMPDHVHLLVLLANTMSMADFMHHVKGGSSRFISTKLKTEGWFGWQKHYAAFAVSWSHRKQVIAYIENQKQHHADGTLWSEAEETDEEDNSDDATALE